MEMNFEIILKSECRNRLVMIDVTNICVTKVIVLHFNSVFVVLYLLYLLYFLYLLYCICCIVIQQNSKTRSGINLSICK